MQPLRGAKKPRPIIQSNSIELSRLSHSAQDSAPSGEHKQDVSGEGVAHRKRPGGAAIYQAPLYRQAPHFNPRSPRGKQPQRQSPDLMRAAQANIDKLMDYYDNISEESGGRQEYGRMAATNVSLPKANKENSGKYRKAEVNLI